MFADCSRRGDLTELSWPVLWMSLVIVMDGMMECEKQDENADGGIHLLLCA